MSTFSDVVGALNGGVTHQKLNDGLAEIVKAVGNTGKPGQITLKVKIAPNGKGGVTITDDIALKVPELPRGASVFFMDEEGNLLRRDPRQAEMFREVVNPETGEVTKAS